MRLPKINDPTVHNRDRMSCDIAVMRDKNGNATEYALLTLPTAVHYPNIRNGECPVGAYGIELKNSVPTGRLKLLIWPCMVDFIQSVAPVKAIKIKKRKK